MKVCKIYIFLYEKYEKTIDCLEGGHEEIDSQNCKINQQQLWSNSYLKFQKDILCGWAAARDLQEIHRETTVADFE